MHDKNIPLVHKSNSDKRLIKKQRSVGNVYFEILNAN